MTKRRAIYIARRFVVKSDFRVLFLFSTHDEWEVAGVGGIQDKGGRVGLAGGMVVGVKGDGVGDDVVEGSLGDSGSESKAVLFARRQVIRPPDECVVGCGEYDAAVYNTRVAPK